MSTTPIPTRYLYLFEQERSKIFSYLSTLKALVHSECTQGTRVLKILEPSSYLGTWTLKHVNHSGPRRAIRYSGTWALEALDLENPSGEDHFNILCTAQKMKIPIKDFFSKCDQICSFLRIWSHLLRKSLMEKFIFCTVMKVYFQTGLTLSINIYLYSFLCY